MSLLKVQGRFNDDTFEKILKKLSKKFLCLYTNNTLFLALKSVKDSDGAEELIDKTFRPIRDFFIDEITEQNVQSLAPVAKEWCLNQLVRLDIERYELANQDKLKQVWLAMDDMEAKLQLQLLREGA